MEKKNLKEIQNVSILPLKNDALVSLDKYAIIETGGKQYFALEGKTIAIEKIDGDSGDEIIFDKVLFRRLNPEVCELGAPYLSVSTKAVIVKQTRGEKIVVFKFKRRKKYRKKMGHRQSHTIVRIVSI